VRVAQKSACAVQQCEKSAQVQSARVRAVVVCAGARQRQRMRQPSRPPACPGVILLLNAASFTLAIEQVCVVDVMLFCLPLLLPLP